MSRQSSKMVVDYSNYPDLRKLFVFEIEKLYIAEIVDITGRDDVVLVDHTIVVPTIFFIAKYGLKLKELEIKWNWYYNWYYYNINWYNLPIKMTLGTWNDHLDATFFRFYGV